MPLVDREAYPLKLVCNNSGKNDECLNQKFKIKKTRKEIRRKDVDRDKNIF